jgi:hypothetical protein
LQSETFSYYDDIVTILNRNNEKGIMKNYMLYVLLIPAFITSQINAYNFEFRNFVPKELTIEMMLTGGIGEQPEQITVPAAIQDASGAIITPGTQSKEFGGLRVGLCLNMKSFKIGEKGTALKNVSELGGLRLVRSLAFIASRTNFDKLLSGEVALTNFLTAKNRLGEHAWRFIRSEEILLCYNRIIAIYEIDGQLSMITWE